MEIGDKVVCTDDDFSKSWADPRKWFDTLPRKSKVYVVRAIKQAKNGEFGLMLVGIHSPPPEAIFYPWRFRKLEEVKREIQLENMAKKNNDCSAEILVDIIQ